MWALIRDWLLVNTVLNGPSDTRRKVQATGSLGRALGLRLLLFAWLALVLLCLVGVLASLLGTLDAASVGMSRMSLAAAYAAVAGGLVLGRWLWRSRS